MSLENPILTLLDTEANYTVAPPDNALRNRKQIKALILKNFKTIILSHKILKFILKKRGYMIYKYSRTYLLRFAKLWL